MFSVKSQSAPWSPVTAELVRELSRRGLTRDAVAVYLAIRARQPRQGRAWHLSRAWLDEVTRPEGRRADSHRRMITRALAQLEAAELLKRQRLFARSGRQCWSAYRVAELDTVDNDVRGRRTRVSSLISDQGIESNPPDLSPFPKAVKRDPIPLSSVPRGTCGTLPGIVVELVRSEAIAYGRISLRSWGFTKAMVDEVKRRIGAMLPEGARRRTIAAWLRAAVLIVLDEDAIPEVIAERSELHAGEDLEHVVQVEDLVDQAPGEVHTGLDLEHRFRGPLDAGATLRRRLRAALAAGVLGLAACSTPATAEILEPGAEVPRPSIPGDALIWLDVVEPIAIPTEGAYDVAGLVLAVSAKQTLADIRHQGKHNE